jgi:hypothetical protein
MSSIDVGQASYLISEVGRIRSGPARRRLPTSMPAVRAHATSIIFVVGGTGAQGMPVIRALVADEKYSVKVLTRDAASPRAQSLLALGNVSLLEGSFADEEVLREGFRGCDGTFVNIDGFNTGEKTEIYWAIRSWQVAGDAPS